MRSIASVRHHSPALPVYFHPAEEGISSRLAKLSMDVWSPFQESLFIDCDTLVTEDISPVFELLDDASLFMAQEAHVPTTLGELCEAPWLASSHGHEYAEALRLLPKDTPLWNSGVILFQKCPKVHSFFQAWRERWISRNSCTPDLLPLTELVAERGSPAELTSHWHTQLSPHDPHSPVPRAAIYHFIGSQKEESYARLQQARRSWSQVDETLLSVTASR